MRSLYRAIPVLAIVLFAFSACEKGQLSPVKNSVVKIDSNVNVTVLPGQLPQALTAVFFTDDKTGFVAGGTGGIYKTINGGSNWKTQNSGVGLPVYGLYFVDNAKGFAVGGESSCTGTNCVPPGGFILRTLNGGQSWTKVYRPTVKTEITSVYFVNSNLGFCVGDNVVYKTTNGGNSWTEQVIENLGGKMMQVKFIDDKKGFIACLFDKIAQTEDGGVTWHIGSAGTNWGYYSIATSEGATYLGGQSKVIKSTDNGNSWRVLPNAPVDAFAIYFNSAKSGIALGRGNYSGGDYGHSYASIYITYDGGDSWAGSANLTDYYSIDGASFPSGKTGYAITLNKVIKVSF